MDFPLGLYFLSWQISKKIITLKLYTSQVVKAYLPQNSIFSNNQPQKCYKYTNITYLYLTYMHSICK